MDLINHIVILVDASGSMSMLTQDVIKVVDLQVSKFAAMSKDFDQETRVSVYLFGDSITNLFFDKDVLRLPSLAGLYSPRGQTALIDATLKGIEDLKQSCTLYGDHSFVLYLLTDGQENASRKRPDDLKKVIRELPDTWTLGALVPDINGKIYCEKTGFPKGNIKIWDTSAAGLEEAGREMEVATMNYMQSRKEGKKSTKNLFSLDTSGLKATNVKKELEPLKTTEYTILPVGKDTPIREFVERWKIDYVIGSCYYLLMKPEKIQAAKQLVLVNKKTGKAYSGQNARDLLGLPDTEVKVKPEPALEWHIYVQSTSVNRKLIAGTNLLVMK